MRILVVLLWTLLSAVLYGLSFPLTSFRWLAWFAQVPFFVAVRRSHLGTAVFLGWVFSVTVAYVTGDWFPRAVSDYYQQPWIVGISFFFGVSSIMAAPCVMAFAAVYRILAARWGASIPLLAAAAWVAGEWGRARLLTGNPWALYGYSQHGTQQLIQIADVTAVYGVSFLLVTVNAALAEIWLSVREKRSMRPALAGGVLAAVAVASALVYGHMRLRDGMLGKAATPAASVAVVQANLDLGSQWRQEMYGRNLDEHLRLTLDALRDGSPALVFWSENSMTFFLDEEPLYQTAISYVLKQGDVQLVAGGPRLLGSRPPTYYNSAFLLSPNGRILARYDKEYLLPFAEYFPFASLDFLRRNFARVREFTHGLPTPPLPTVAGPGGVVICNEAMYPEIATQRVREGAEYLVNLSNDTWLNDHKFSEITLNMVAFRAIEQRRYVVRASTSGPSAIIDPYGRVTVRTKSLSRGVISGTITASNSISPYGRIGDVFAGLCTVAAFAALLRHRRRRPH